MMKCFVTKAKVEEEGGENKINNEQQRERERVGIVLKVRGTWMVKYKLLSH